MLTEGTVAWWQLYSSVVPNEWYQKWLHTVYSRAALITGTVVNFDTTFSWYSISVQLQHRPTGALGCFRKQTVPKAVQETTPQLFQIVIMTRDSLLVRAPDSWSKGCEFEFRQERRENFLRQSQLCVLTLIWCPFHPCVTAVIRKRPRSFCKSASGRLHLNMHTPLTQRSRSGLTMPLSRRSVGTYQERVHTQLVREHSVTVVSAHWATVDWSWPREWN